MQNVTPVWGQRIRTSLISTK